jgi:hypothetical protein
MNRQEREELAVYVSERMGGEEFNPDNIKTLGNWVLIKEKNWDGHWECNAYDASQGMSWECWDEVPMDQSPFGTKDQTVIDKALNNLNKRYCNYLEKEDLREAIIDFPYDGKSLEDKEFCLYAISGDCSAGALNHKAEVIPFKNKHFDLVSKFLAIAMKKEVQLMKMVISKKQLKPIHFKTTEAFCNAFDALKKVGIFEHKYHARSKWVIDYTCDVLSNGDPESYWINYLNENNKEVA